MSTSDAVKPSCWKEKGSNAKPSNTDACFTKLTQPKIKPDAPGQAGFVLTRQKGEGRKAVATYALTKTAPPGEGAQRHPPHTPHLPSGAKTSTKSTVPENRT